MILSTNEAKELVKNHTGISVHGKCFRVSFFYQGVRKLESLKNVPLTKANLKHAVALRAAVCRDITLGTFDYLKNFPNSKEALRILKEEKGKNMVPFDLYIEKVLTLSQRQTRPKTHYNLANRTKNYVIPFFRGQCLNSITVSEIKLWISEDLDHLANKTIGEVLTSLRAAFRLAYDDEMIETNPMDRIKNPTRANVDNADPFTKEEIEKIELFDTTREIEKQAIILAFWTGLRPSELLALSLDDINITNKTLKVKRSVVKGKYAYTKNDGSYRIIDLLDQAMIPLQKLLSLRKDAAVTKAKVLDSDNKRESTEELRFLVVSSNTLQPWGGNESFSKIMKLICNGAKVRYRAIGQARHTFGSQLITACLPLKWIAEQMGHKSIKMLEKHYGRWMKSESPDMANKASRLLDEDMTNKPSLLLDEDMANEPSLLLDD